MRTGVHADVYDLLVKFTKPGERELNNILFRHFSTISWHDEDTVAHLLHVLCVCVIHISFYGCNMVFLSSSVTNKLNYSCYRNNLGWIKIANAH